MIRQTAMFLAVCRIGLADPGIRGKDMVIINQCLRYETPIQEPTQQGHD
jgi:hypothetical protein